MKILFKKLLGLVLIVTAVVGLALCGMGIVFGQRLVDGLSAGLSESLELTGQSLETAYDTLDLAEKTVGQVNDGLETVEGAALDVAQAISQTRPFLGQVAQVVSHDVPESVEAVQAAVPGMAKSAAVVDATLFTLSNLRVERKVMGVPFQFDLGIEYDPDVPFAVSVNDMGESLEGVPTRLRDLEPHIWTTDSNLVTLSGDIIAITEDLDAINESIAEVAPLLDDTQRIVKDMNDLVGRADRSVSKQTGALKLAVMVVMAWIGLTQLAPLTLGWGLLFGEQPGEEIVPETAVAVEVQAQDEPQAQPETENEVQPESDSGPAGAE